VFLWSVFVMSAATSAWASCLRMRKIGVAASLLMVTLRLIQGSVSAASCPAP
jgi:hypothetical protein